MSLRRAARWQLAVVAVAMSAVVGCTNPERAKRAYLESGDEYTAQGKHREAIIQYQNALKQDATFAEARVKLAKAYSEVGNLQASVQQYVRAADLLPRDTELQVQVGTFMLMAGRFEDAKARAERALEADPRQVDAHILLGNAIAGLEDFEVAIDQIEQAIELDPGQARSYASLGAVHAAQGKAADAEAAFRRAVDVEPKSAEAQLALANFFWSAGRMDEAEQSLVRALALDQRNQLTHRALATLYMSTGRVVKAEPHLKAVADVSGHPAARLQLADYYLRSDRQREGRKLLNALSTERATAAPALIRLAVLAYGDEQPKEAYKKIDAALAASPRSVDALVVKAGFLRSEGKLGDARAVTEQAVKVDAQSVPARYQLGTILAAQGETKEAVEAFNEVLRLNPRATAAQVQLAQLELARGAPEASVQLARQAIKTDPNDPAARMLLVRGYMAQRRFDEADAELQALVKAHPKVAAVHTQVGRLRTQQRNPRDARAAFERALALDASSIDATAGLTSLDLAEGRREAALARVDARLKQSPDDPRILIVAARAHLLARDAARGEELLRACLKIAPNTFEAYSLLGQLYLSQRKLDQALRELDALAARQPRQVAAQTLAAIIVQTQGKQAEAQKRYEKIVDADSRAAVASNNLAWLYAEQGTNLDMALQLARTAKAALPEVAEIDDTLGYVYLQKSQPALAIGPLQEAVKRNPNRPEFRYRLGLAYSKTGDAAAARRELEQALEIEANFTGADDARALLRTLS